MTYDLLIKGGTLFRPKDKTFLQADIGITNGRILGIHPRIMPEEAGTLPAKCDGCGAPVIPDEVEWHDARTAECLYCGTVLKVT